MFNFPGGMIFALIPNFANNNCSCSSVAGLFRQTPGAMTSDFKVFNPIKMHAYEKTLLLSLLMVLALAARAVEVTFVAPEGYTIQYVQVDNGSYLTGTYDPTSGKVTYAVDLAAGQHSVRAGLHADDGSWDAITGGAQTFTVGETPMTVTYGTDNFAVINLTLLDENGAPFEGVGLQVTDDVLFSVSCTTGADGTAQAYIPADAGTFTYGISTIISRDNVTYARLSQTATLQGKEMNLTLSYAACQQVTLNVPSF